MLTHWEVEWFVNDMTICYIRYNTKQYENYLTNESGLRHE
jgi:hypothetical protein